MEAGRRLLKENMSVVAKLVLRELLAVLLRATEPMVSDLDKARLVEDGPALEYGTEKAVEEEKFVKSSVLDNRMVEKGVTKVEGGVFNEG